MALIGAAATTGRCVAMPPGVRVLTRPVSLAKAKFTGPCGTTGVLRPAVKSAAFSARNGLSRGAMVSRPVSMARRIRLSGESLSAVAAR